MKLESSFAGNLLSAETTDVRRETTVERRDNSRLSSYVCRLGAPPRSRARRRFRLLHASSGWGGAPLDLLKDPKVVDRILADFEHVGIVGKRDNLLVGYLAA